MKEGSNGGEAEAVEKGLNKSKAKDKQTGRERETEVLFLSRSLVEL